MRFVKEQKVLVNLLDSLLILKLPFESYFFIFVKDWDCGVEISEQIIGSEVKRPIIVIWISQNPQARYYPNSRDNRLHLLLNIISQSSTKNQSIVLFFLNDFWHHYSEHLYRIVIMNDESCWIWRFTEHEQQATGRVKFIVSIRY